MDTILIEINKFITKSKLANSTKKNYFNHLYKFANYLSALTKLNLCELHLEDFYKVHSSTGVFLFFRPINADLLDKYLFDHSEKGYHWLKKSRSAICSLFLYLHRNYDFPNIPRDMKFDLSEYKKSKRPQRILSRHEILLLMHNIVHHCEDLYLEPLLFSILICTGCRISEILNLKVCDVNCEEDSLFLRNTKKKSQRKVMLRDEFGLAIKKYIELKKLTSQDFLFCTDEKEKITRYYVQKLLIKYLSYSKLEPMNIHGLRHSFATLMYESDSELIVIQQLLDHSFLSSTQNYVTPNYIRNYGIVIKENKEVYGVASKVINWC
ncbi:tyrosine-type recombinase/integrase [Brevibacillus sp. SYSU BS000544]|uniref:tyrosine-type recombinase/integrase n=1 Tax=Brevibacillus sp. SYSU BS000544 TaxID=3416443 RepID=UPI003CE4D8BB